MKYHEFMYENIWFQVHEEVYCQMNSYVKTNLFQTSTWIHIRKDTWIHMWLIHIWILKNMKLYINFIFEKHIMALYMNWYTFNSYVKINIWIRAAAIDSGRGKGFWPLQVSLNVGGPRRVTRASSSDGRPRQMSESGQGEWGWPLRVTAGLASDSGPDELHGLRNWFGLGPQSQSDGQTVGCCEWLGPGAGAND